MSILDIANSIRTRFDELVVQTVEPALVTQYDNNELTEAQVQQREIDGRWARVSIQFDGARQAALCVGSRIWRYAGRLVVELFFPVNTGTFDTHSLADTVMTTFRSISVGQVVYKTPVPPTPITPTEGGWYKTVVHCPFHADVMEGD